MAAPRVFKLGDLVFEFCAREISLAVLTYVAWHYVNRIMLVRTEKAFHDDQHMFNHFEEDGTFRNLEGAL